MTSFLNDATKKQLTSLISVMSASRNVFYGTSLAVLLSIPLFRHARADYQTFLRRGPGGIPNTFAGYIFTTFLRVFYAHADLFILRHSLIPSMRRKLTFSPAPCDNASHNDHRPRESHHTVRPPNYVRRITEKMVVANCHPAVWLCWELYRCPTPVLVGIGCYRCTGR